jgi:hypothetical protein
VIRLICHRDGLPFVTMTPPAESWSQSAAGRRTDDPPFSTDAKRFAVETTAVCEQRASNKSIHIG